jgi:hypothetical protein
MSLKKHGREYDIVLLGASGSQMLLSSLIKSKITT